MRTQCTHMHMTKSTNKQQINITKPPNYQHIHFARLYATTQVYHRIDAITTKWIPNDLVKWNHMSCVCLSEATPFYTFRNQVGRAANQFVGKQWWYDIILCDLRQHVLFALIYCCSWSCFLLLFLSVLCRSEVNTLWLLNMPPTWLSCHWYARLAFLGW